MFIASVACKQEKHQDAIKVLNSEMKIKESVFTDIWILLINKSRKTLDILITNKIKGFLITVLNIVLGDLHSEDPMKKAIAQK